MKYYVFLQLVNIEIIEVLKHLLTPCHNAGGFLYPKKGNFTTKVKLFSLKFDIVRKPPLYLHHETTKERFQYII